jgi:hypothetical protein
LSPELRKEEAEGSLQTARNSAALQVSRNATILKELPERITGKNLKSEPLKRTVPE